MIGDSELFRYIMDNDKRSITELNDELCRLLAGAMAAYTEANNANTVSWTGPSAKGNTDLLQIEKADIDATDELVRYLLEHGLGRKEKSPNAKESEG